MSFYLGPSRPVTHLQTWEQVEAAAQGGLLGEHQWVELKKDLGPTGKEVNVELAKDLASLAVDGGLLIFGIADKTFDVVGCDTAPIVERVSQVAAARIHPPLSPVIHDPVVDPQNPGRAVLVVQVPRSSTPPHMVDGNYWGRSADGKRTLGDEDVRRLMGERIGSKERFEQSLAELVVHDPLAAFLTEEPQNGHFYLLAEPIAEIHGSHSFTYEALERQLRAVRKTAWATGLDRLETRANDPDGTAFVFGRNLPPEDEHWLTYVSVQEDGRIIVAGGGASAAMRGDPTPHVLPGLITTLTVQALQLVARAALEHWGYAGEWRVGIHATKLRGLTPNSHRFGVPFANDTYTRLSVISPATWQDEGWLSPAQEMLNGLYRGLGMDGTQVKRML